MVNWCSLTGKGVKMDIKRGTTCFILGVFTFLSFACGGGGGDGIVYDDSSLDGVWLAIFSGSDEVDVFFETDGNGNVVDYSFFDLPPQGIYSVSSDGSFTLTLLNGLPGEYSIDGQLTSNTTGNFVGVGGTAPIKKVTDISAMEGTLSGTITETCTDNITYPLLCDGTVYNVDFTVDASGDVTGSITDGTDTFTVQTGKAYIEGSNVVMLLTNTTSILFGELLSYDLMKLEGTLSGNSIAGIFSNDYGGDSAIGTLAFTFAAAP